MAAPRIDTCRWDYQNPDASQPLHIPVLVMVNTPDEELEANVRANTALELPWLAGVEPHDGIAIMVGGGASVADHLDDIRRLVADGGTIFAMNAASQYLRGHGIAVDWQVTCDAKAETASLIDPSARGHLLASHVSPVTLAAAPKPILWHSALHANEDHFPPKKKKRGGYALLGGEASSGLGALCVAYALGFRRLELFGYDSSHRDGQGHAYRQRMNDVIPVMTFEWAGRSFQTSVTMRTQAERFPITAQALQQAGATLTVWGDGLLQHIWRTPVENLGERDKYVRAWMLDAYRAYSPAETLVTEIAGMIGAPSGPVIDFGCGTGRAGIKLAALGYDVVLVDFVSAARDHEALELPFVEWDLTKPCPLRAPFGYCCDVLEHIPREQVEAVIQNILASAETVFFQVSTVPDSFGAVIGQTLHMTVEPHDWWFGAFEKAGAKVCVSKLQGPTSQFIVTRT